jgi:hypothetical protein
MNAKKVKDTFQSPPIPTSWGWALKGIARPKGTPKNQFNNYFFEV